MHTFPVGTLQHRVHVHTHVGAVTCCLLTLNGLTILSIHFVAKEHATIVSNRHVTGQHKDYRLGEN